MRSLSEVDVIRPMIAAMDARPDIIVLACEALHQIFDKNQSALVDQAIKAELVQYLLKLLETDLRVAYKIENAAASKAQIVKALKAMSRDFLHGEKVCIEFCVSLYILFVPRNLYSVVIFLC